MACLCTTQNEATTDVDCWFTAHFDNGGLVYSGHTLQNVILRMEDAFTYFFLGKHALHEENLAGFGRELCSVNLSKLGCPEHEAATRPSVVKFNILLRTRFYVEGLNKDRGTKATKKIVEVETLQLVGCLQRCAFFVSLLVYSLNGVAGHTVSTDRMQHLLSQYT